MAQTLDSLDFDVILDTNIANKENFIRTIRESLKQAKISLMKDYPSPYYWGAFVLIQD